METKARQIEEAREKNRSSAEHLAQEINRAREEATRAVIEKAKHQIESDQVRMTRPLNKCIINNEINNCLINSSEFLHTNTSLHFLFL